MSNEQRDELSRWVAGAAQRALGFATTLVRNRADAEDVVHDCFVRLLKKAGAYDLPRDGDKLLLKSIANACINLTQRRRESTSTDDGIDVPDPTACEPFEATIAGELEVALHEAMGELGVAERAAVELRSLGCSMTEVAEAIGASHGNARVILHRARTKLAERLKPFLAEIDE